MQGVPKTARKRLFEVKLVIEADYVPRKAKDRLRLLHPRVDVLNVLGSLLAMIGYVFVPRGVEAEIFSTH